jgi:hypothetical protein
VGGKGRRYKVKISLLQEIEAHRVAIKMYLGEIVWGGMDCVDLAFDRNQWKALVNAAMQFRFP